MSTPKHDEAIDRTALGPEYISMFKEKMTSTRALFEKAQQVIPGGISHFPRWHIRILCIVPGPVGRACGMRMAMNTSTCGWLTMMQF
jgi:hypothetical protein